MIFSYHANSIELYDAAGSRVAEVAFPDLDEKTVEISHTFVDGSLKGQGVAAQLLEAAARQLRAKKKKAVLTCPYAVKWFESHPEYRDIVKK